MTSTKTFHFRSLVRLTLGIFFVERPDVKCICGVDFPARGHQGRRVLLLVDLAPVKARVERVFLQLGGSPATTPKPLVHVALKTIERPFY